MRVVDAGVLVEVAAGSLHPRVLGDDEMAAPHLIDSEVTHALRGMVLRGRLSDFWGAIALEVFASLAITRYPADWLRPRMWELRHNLSGYDATYVALAELLETPLLTTDARLTRAPGIRCDIRLV